MTFFSHSYPHHTNNMPAQPALCLCCEKAVNHKKKRLSSPKKYAKRSRTALQPAVPDVQQRLPLRLRSLV